MATLLELSTAAPKTFRKTFVQPTTFREPDVSYQVGGRAVSVLTEAERQRLRATGVAGPRIVSGEELSRQATVGRVTSVITAKYYGAGVPGGMIRSPTSGIVARLGSIQGKRILEELGRERARASAVVEEPIKLAIEKEDVFSYTPEPSAPTYVAKIPAQVTTERKSIEREIGRLETEQSRIEKLQKSMVARDMPSTSLAIREYNVELTGLRSRVADYGRSSLITQFSLSATERKRASKEFDIFKKSQAITRLKDFDKDYGFIEIPLSRQFGLEAAEATFLGTTYEIEAMQRSFC